MGITESYHNALGEYCDLHYDTHPDALGDCIDTIPKLFDLEKNINRLMEMNPGMCREQASLIQARLDDVIGQEGYEYGVQKLKRENKWI